MRVALLALARTGMVQAYLYEPQTQRYVPISPSEAATAAEAWFMSTPNGIAERDLYDS